VIEDNIVNDGDASVCNTVTKGDHMVVIVSYFRRILRAHITFLDNTPSSSYYNSESSMVSSFSQQEM
jgi:hypothetical protein